jgi:hypothetical protein
VTLGQIRSKRVEDTAERQTFRGKAPLELTAKTVYILAGGYKVKEALVAATVSITTLFSVVTLLGWLYALSALVVEAS